MRLYALIMAALWAVYDKCSMLDEWRGIGPASAAERAFFGGKW